MRTFSSVLMVVSVLAFSFVSSASLASEIDFLDRQQIIVKSKNFNTLMVKTVDNAKELFSRYEVALPDNAKIARPLSIGGSTNRPVVSLSLKKCIAFICKTVDFVAEMTIENSSGECDMNYRVRADLSQSSGLLTEAYEQFYVQICANKTVNGGLIGFAASAKRAPGDSSRRADVAKMISKQISPIVKAFQATMARKENSL